MNQLFKAENRTVNFVSDTSSFSSRNIKQVLSSEFGEAVEMNRYVSNELRNE